MVIITTKKGLGTALQFINAIQLSEPFKVKPVNQKKILKNISVKQLLLYYLSKIYLNYQHGKK